ncbi:acyltransferase family protein [Streptomyces sp. NPDC021218]|uniref:acyltransferase family protein n=1 Tax=unclassified Streptomyces TaxID=2593676 RepID=UPI0036A322DA
MTHTPTAFRPRRDTAPGQRATGLSRRLRGHRASRSGGRMPKAAFRRDIQGLRGLAVTLVVLAHAGVPYVIGGHTGVDVFFVISGFLITAGLLKEAEHTGSVSLRRFCARRAVRILPLATLVALVTMVGCRLSASKIRYPEFMHDALAGALYVMNIDLAVSGTDYLDEGSAPSPFRHFWSLSMEEQFYLLWPVLLLASRKLIRLSARRADPCGCGAASRTSATPSRTPPAGKPTGRAPAAPVPPWSIRSHGCAPVGWVPGGRGRHLRLPRREPPGRVLRRGAGSGAAAGAAETGGDRGLSTQLFGGGAWRGL